MKFLVGLVLVAGGLVTLAGCGQAGPGSATAPADDAAANTPSAEAADSPQPASEGISAADTDSPAKAVGVFLEAVRKGDDARAEAMLTPVAREKTSKMGIQVAPKGSDTARFEVGETENLAADGARVKTVWSELDETWQPRSDEIIWMVRREAEGWRVAGMATVVFPGEDPLLLDFENPEETMQKLEQLQQEIARRSGAGGEPTGGELPKGTALPPEFPQSAQVGSQEIPAESVRR